jgi:hypothetical protein
MKNNVNIMTAAQNIFNGNSGLQTPRPYMQHWYPASKGGPLFWQNCLLFCTKTTHFLPLSSLKKNFKNYPYMVEGI